MAPQFSICIPSYNRADLLDFCLERLQPLEKFNIPFEIVVSDNASTDHTPEVVKKRRESMPYIRYVRQATNVGMWANWRNAIWNAASPLVAYVADDDSIIPENLIPHIERLQREPELVGIYTDSIAWDDEHERELHRYYNLERGYTFGPEDPLGLVNFICQRLLYPELGAYRRESFLQAPTVFKHSVPPFHLWMYRLSRIGRVAFDMHAFYRESRTLKKRFGRGHWGNMDLSLVYIDDRLRNTLESVLLMALQDSGTQMVPDEQQFKVRQIIERFLHGRTSLEIQRAMAAKNWVLAMELRRRLVLWYGPGSQQDQQRDAVQITFPAALQAIQETYLGLSDVSGIEFRGFRTDQLAEFFRTHYPETPLLPAGRESSAGENTRPLVVHRLESAREELSEAERSGYVLYLDRLLANYRVGPIGVDTSNL